METAKRQRRSTSANDQAQPATASREKSKSFEKVDPRLLRLVELLASAAAEHDYTTCDNFTNSQLSQASPAVNVGNEINEERR